MEWGCHFCGGFSFMETAGDYFRVNICEETGLIVYNERMTVNLCTD